MKIKLYPSGWCEVSGSIHKYFNDGKHNFNQFDKINLIESVSLLSDKLKVILRNFKVSGLEIGANIIFKCQISLKCKGLYSKY
jgi:hypothetical protein